MNKQVIIAGLLGAASAQAPVAECDDQFTVYSIEQLEMMEEHRRDFAAATAGLEEAAELEATNVENATAALATQQSLMVPFQNALDTAATNWSEQSENKQEAASLISSLGDTSTASTQIYDAQVAYDAAEGLMNTAQGKYNAQVYAVSQLLVAQTEHNTEVGTLTTALETATTNEETKISAYEAAEAVKQAFIDERAVETTGQAAILVTKTEEYEAAEEAFDDDETEEQAAFSAGGGATGWLPAKKDRDERAEYIAILAAGCAFAWDMSAITKTDNASGSATEAMDCETQASDPIGVIKAGIVSAYSGLETEFEADRSAWETKVTDYATTKSLQSKALAWKEIATTNDTDIGTKATDEDSTILAANEAKAEATEEKETAATDLATGETQESNAQTDYARGEDILAELLDVLTPLRDDYVVKTYLLAQQEQALATETAVKEAADALLADLRTLEEMAEETVDRAQLAVDFYTLRLEEATESNYVAIGMLSQNLGNIEMVDEYIEEAETALDQAFAMCKSNGYDKAQAALRAKLDKDAADDDLIEEVKEDYDIQSAMPSDGTAGTLCNYTVRTSLDEDVGDRPLCNEGLCCGAAQKFMKDGTKLAIETCQALTTRTYQYYPPLPARAVAAPAVETWRFQCISGAQKLVAAATAALAASYMMA